MAKHNVGVKTHLGQPPSDRACPLWSQAQGNVLLVLVVFPKVLASLLVHDGQDPGDRLANGGANGNVA